MYNYSCRSKRGAGFKSKMEAREKESKSVLLFLGMANHREEAENSSPEHSSLLAAADGTVNDWERRQSSGESTLWETCLLLSSFVLPSDLGTFHKVTCPMLSLKEMAIHMSFFTALQRCQGIAAELTQSFHFLNMLCLRNPKDTILLFFIPYLGTKLIHKSIGRVYFTSSRGSQHSFAFCVFVLGLGLLQLSKRKHYKVKKRKVRLLVAQRTSWQERSSTGRAQGLAMLF